jgi:colanic acid biosynthesis glycosyl transferase WcaI
LGEKFVVLFAGNVGHSQGLENVLRTADLLRGREEILFLILGNGVAKAGLESMAAELRLPNVRFLPYQPQKRVPEIYASSDIGLVPLKEGFTTESVPSKVQTIMAAARPIVASVDAGSATETVIESARCGLCVDLEDSQALADAILTLYDNPKLANTLGQNGRQYMRNHFTPEIVARKYEKLFLELVNHR